MFDRLAARSTKLLLAVLVVIAILGTAALPGVIGWFVADWADGSRIAGVVISYWVAGSLAWLLWNKDTEVLAISTVLAYVTAAPLIYLLTLATRALQVAVGAAPLGGPGDFLLGNLDGVLLGTALGVGLSLLGAQKKGMEPLGPSGSRPDLNESFRLGLSFRIRPSPYADVAPTR